MKGLKKASKTHAAQAKALKESAIAQLRKRSKDSNARPRAEKNILSTNPEMQKYMGRSIKGEYGGVNLSNPSYVKYYKGMLD